ncbi:MAG: hypothetical protein NT112_04415 [Methanoregula sp.]|nr:hypothetical protein [Methanoregula sp.]
MAAFVMAARSPGIVDGFSPGNMLRRSDRFCRYTDKNNKIEH